MECKLHIVWKQQNQTFQLNKNLVRSSAPKHMWYTEWKVVKKITEEDFFSDFSFYISVGGLQNGLKVKMKTIKCHELKLIKKIRKGLFGFQTQIDECYW